MEITRRNFIKGLVALSAVGLPISANANKVDVEPKIKRFYSVHDISCINPCGEITIFGEDRKSAEAYALYHKGRVEYADFIGENKIREGNYRMSPSRKVA